MLVAALLSSQTKDAVTHAAVERLRAAGLLTLEGMLGAEQEKVQKLIYPVSRLPSPTDPTHRSKGLRFLTRLLHLFRLIDRLALASLASFSRKSALILRSLRFIN